MLARLAQEQTGARGQRMLDAVDERRAGPFGDEDHFLAVVMEVLAHVAARRDRLGAGAEIDRGAGVRAVEQGAHEAVGRHRLPEAVALVRPHHHGDAGLMLLFHIALVLLT